MDTDPDQPIQQNDTGSTRSGSESTALVTSLNVYKARLYTVYCTKKEMVSGSQLCEIKEIRIWTVRYLHQ